MIDVRQADAVLAEHTVLLPCTEHPLEACHGRILREDIRADRDQPPYHRVTMDGIALSSKAVAGGTRVFRRQAVQAAGQRPLELEGSDACIEVTTGAVLPSGCDAVIRLEDVELREEQAFLSEGVVPVAMQNVHRKGSDAVADEVLVPKGVRLSPAHIAIAASVGAVTLPVSSLPRIAVVSTGDELVPIASAVEEHQVRRSNGPAIASALSSRGYGEATLCHLDDDREALSAALAAMLERFDMLVLSGGVSMGRFDFVPEVLAELGVDNHIRKVRQRPGKPLWFGTRGEKPVFALPGNPVSTMVCLYRYVLPFLERASGAIELPLRRIRLAAQAQALPGFTRFLPVALEPQGQLEADPVELNTSGDLVSLGRSDGFVEMEGNGEMVPAGTELPFHAWRMA